MKSMSPNIQELIRGGFDARRKGDFRHAKAQFQLALSESRRIKDFRGEANALLELSVIAIDFDGDFDSGRKLLQESLEICKKIHDDVGEAYAASNLGSLALDEKKYDDALMSLERARSTFEKTSEKYGMAMTLHQMGKTKMRLGEFTSAEKNLRQSLLIFEGLGDKYAVGQTLRSLASIAYEKDKDKEQTKQLLHRAEVLFEEISNQAEANLVRHFIAVIEGREV